MMELYANTNNNNNNNLLNKNAVTLHKISERQKDDKYNVVKKAQSPRCERLASSSEREGRIVFA